MRFAVGLIPFLTLDRDKLGQTEATATSSGKKCDFNIFGLVWD